MPEGRRASGRVHGLVPAETRTMAVVAFGETAESGIHGYLIY
jgi:hypothetical protein